MDALVNNFQVGQKFGSGTIVNPSQISSEQLKGSKLVTVLVPTGGLAEGEKLDLQTQNAPVNQGPSIKFDKYVAGKLAASSILGGAVGFGVTALTKSTTAGVAVGTGVTALSYASGADVGTAIDVIGGSAVGALIGVTIGAALKSMPAGLGAGIVVGTLAFTVSRAMGGI